MDNVQLVESVKELAKAKGLSEDVVFSALEAALVKGYIKVLGGGDDAIVQCTIDPETGKLYLAQIKKVVEDVQDDYLEIEVDEANEGLKKAKYKVGDDFPIEANIEDLTKATAMGVRSYFRQGLAEAERAELYKIYKDRIGEMVVGTVEKADDRIVLVNIGRATVELGRKELIGDEYFKAGDQIKVYIQEVRSADEANSPFAAPNASPVATEGANPAQPAAPAFRRPRGPQIQATRASEGFLKRLFEEEIHEIYDGTVLIKAIARQAGVRSKVAVSSTNDDIDATGACIGQGGSRIQKVVGQLGNGRNKEKIDIIEWSDYAPKFIMESVRPSIALGVHVDEENKSAIVVLSKEAFEAQLGRYRGNLNLASKLTGYKISFLPQQKAEEEGLEYVTMEQADVEAKRLKAAKEAEEYRRKTLEAQRKAEEEAKAKAAAEEEARQAALEAQRKAEEEARRAAKVAGTKAEPLPVTPAVAPKANVSPEAFPAEAMNPAAAALAALHAAKAEAAAPAVEAPQEAPLAEEKPAEEKAPVGETPVEAPKKPVEEVREVKTTTTLSDLEAELENSRGNKPSGKPTYSKSSKRPRKISEEEVKREAAPKIPEGTGLGVTYTEAELAEIEAEERNANEADLGDDEIDYDDYDEYYDDDAK